MRYKVDIFETVCHSTWVEADSSDEAESIAYEYAMNDVGDEDIIANTTESLGTGKIDVYELKVEE